MDKFIQFHLKHLVSVVVAAEGVCDGALANAGRFHDPSIIIAASKYDQSVLTVLNVLLSVAPPEGSTAVCNTAPAFTAARPRRSGQPWRNCAGSSPPRGPS